MLRQEPAAGRIGNTAQAGDEPGGQIGASRLGFGDIARGGVAALGRTAGTPVALLLAEGDVARNAAREE